MKACNIVASNTDFECDNIENKVKKIISISKGRAFKAFIKNLETGNIKNLQKQINKGTVKIYNL